MGKQDLCRLPATLHRADQHQFRCRKRPAKFNRFLLCQSDSSFAKRLVYTAAGIAVFQIAGCDAVPDQRRQTSISFLQCQKSPCFQKNTGYNTQALCDCLGKYRSYFLRMGAKSRAFAVMQSTEYTCTNNFLYSRRWDLFQSSRPVSRLRLSADHTPSRNGTFQWHVYGAPRHGSGTVQDSHLLP